MQKIVITGANGFLGSHLVERLKKKKGIEVKIFDRKKHSLFDKRKLSELVEDCDILYYLAGVCDSSDPEIFKVNVLGTLNILEAVSKMSPKCHFVFASTFSVYETPQKGELIKESSLVAPKNTYGLTKYLAEEIVYYFSRNMGIKSTILRMSNIYGPGMKAFLHSVVATFIEKIRNEEELIINGSGNQTRDFVYVEDVVDALLLTASINDKFEIVNICSGESTSLNEIVRYLEKIIGKKAKVVYKKQAIEGGYWKADYSRANRVLFWNPKTILKSGLIAEYGGK